MLKFEPSAFEASLTQPTSSLVLPDIADTTTATSWPASTSRLTCRATLRMRAMSATEVPPNFITMRAMEAISPCEVTSGGSASRRLDESPEKAGP